MTDIRQSIAQEFSLSPRNVNNALDLWLEGGTLPFIARYREKWNKQVEILRLSCLKSPFQVKLL